MKSPYAKNYSPVCQMAKTQNTYGTISAGKTPIVHLEQHSHTALACISVTYF